MMSGRRAVRAVWQVQGLIVVLCVMGTSGCRSSHPSISTVPSVVRRTPVYLDSAGVADGVGQLRVAVRSAPRPTEGLGDALVTVLDQQLAVVARRSTTAAGLAIFPRLPSGGYSVRVQRLGYDALTIAVPVTAGCASDAEAYLAMSFIGIEAVVVDTVATRGRRAATSPPSLRVTGARATITLCEGDG